MSPQWVVTVLPSISPLAANTSAPEHHEKSSVWPLAMLPEPIEHWHILGRANIEHGWNDDDVWAMLELGTNSANERCGTTSTPPVSVRNPRVSATA